MATLSSGRLYDLIERLLYLRRDTPHAVFDILPRHFPAVRLLAETDPPNSRKADDAWLERVELRGPKRFAQALEKSGFRERTGVMEAWFVDDRCGLITSQVIGCAADLDPNRAVADVLRFASTCQASGIVLATHDVTGKFAHTSKCRDLTMDLYRKGEAIDVFLLDHFLLTAGGWKRMFALNDKGPI